jgi:hypothetical protein
MRYVTLLRAGNVSLLHTASFAYSHSYHANKGRVSVDERWRDKEGENQRHGVRKRQNKIREFERDKDWSREVTRSKCGAIGRKFGEADSTVCYLSELCLLHEMYFAELVMKGGSGGEGEGWKGGGERERERSEGNVSQLITILLKGSKEGMKRVS